MSVDESVSNLRKRRGTIRKSITSLAKNVSELGKRADDSATPANATIVLSSLEYLDSDLKVLHFKLIDLIRDDDERTLDKEQDYLDKHNDDVTSIKLQIQELLTATSLPKSPGVMTHKALSRRMSRMEVKLQATVDGLSGSSSSLDATAIELHSDRLADTKKALESVYDDLLSLDLDDTDPMFTLHSKLDRLHFDCSLKAKKIRSSIAPSTPAPATSAMDGKGVKLPKLDVPTFDGDILNWN